MATTPRTQLARRASKSAASAPSQHDLLAVNGRASLAGALQLLGVGGFKLHVGDQVTFLTANGGVSGSFGTIQSEFATLGSARGTPRADPNPLGPAPAVFDRGENIFSPSREAG